MALSYSESPDLKAEEDGGLLAMGMVMLVCAVLASLALGVLVAYGLCQAMFRVFRVHAQNAARSRAMASTLRTVRG